MTDTPTPALRKPPLRIKDVKEITAMVAIDGHAVDVLITRPTSDEFHELARTFRKIQEAHGLRRLVLEKRLLDMTAAQRAHADQLASEEDAAAHAFLVGAVSRYVRILPAQIYNGDVEITSGTDFAALFSHRQDVLTDCFTEIMKAAAPIVVPAEDATPSA